MEKNVPPRVELPAPTAWPIVFAFGVTLLFAGLVTNAAISIVGAIAVVSAAVGWFRDVLPVEAHEEVAVLEEMPPVVTRRPEVTRLDTAPVLPRPRLPVETYPISAGIKGGLAGGAVMAVLAMLYGVLSRHGIWYPINLLAAGLFPALSRTTADIATFRPYTLLVATAIHLIASLLVGVLYGAMLPMIPRRPILLGGVVAPILWSGLLYNSLEIINPVLNERIDWIWFVLSQIGFGLVAGTVVLQQERVLTSQGIPASSAGGDTVSGATDNRGERDGDR